MRGIISQGANRSRSESPVRDVDPVTTPKRLVRLPNTATCCCHPQGALLQRTRRRDRERSDSAGCHVLASVPIQKRWVNGILRAKREPRGRRSLAFADAIFLDHVERGPCTGDFAGRDLVTAVQLIILVGPGCRLLTDIAKLRRKQLLSVL